MLMTLWRLPSRLLRTSVPARGAQRSCCPKRPMAVWIFGFSIHDWKSLGGVRTSGLSLKKKSARLKLSALSAIAFVHIFKKFHCQLVDVVDVRQLGPGNLDLQHPPGRGNHLSHVQAVRTIVFHGFLRVNAGGVDIVAVRGDVLLDHFDHRFFCHVALLYLVKSLYLGAAPQDTGPSHYPETGGRSQR